MVGHKERAFERVQKRGLVDVAVGIVDEYAGFHVSLCVDVQIVPSTGDTAAHILSVVLEIHGKERFALTEFPDTMVNSLSLFRCGKKLYSGVVSNGHIMEEPAEQRAGINDVIKEFLAADILVIPAGIAGRDSKGKPGVFQKIHGVLYLCVASVSPPSVVGILEAFQGNSRNKVLHAQHFFAEIIVYQRAVCE